MHFAVPESGRAALNAVAFLKLEGSYENEDMDTRKGEKSA